MNTANNKVIVERLTALWALTECGLGGFLHAFSIPFTAIFVGGVSILLISLIAFYTDTIWKSIFKALSIVLLIKLSVSPHTPISAYTAVSFQAIAGAVIFSVFSWKSFGLILLGVITFLESALQKLFTLTLIYGETIWDAINIYGAWVVSKMSFLPETTSSKLLISTYLIVYTLSGIFVGYFIKQIITLIKNEGEITLSYNPKQAANNMLSNGGNKKIRRKFFIFWGLTILLILLPLVLWSSTEEGLQKGIYLISRSILVLGLWYIIVGPFLLKLLKLLLKKNKSNYKQEIENALDLFPYLQDIISFSWRETKLLKGSKRVKHFMAKSILYSIHFKVPLK